MRACKVRGNACAQLPTPKLCVLLICVFRQNKICLIYKFLTVKPMHASYISRLIIISSNVHHHQAVSNLHVKHTNLLVGIKTRKNVSLVSMIKG